MKKAVLLVAVSLCLAACHCERRTTGTPCRKAACQAANACTQNCKSCACIKTVAQEAARQALEERDAQREAELREREAAQRAEEERLAAEKAQREAAAQQEKDFSQMADVRTNTPNKVVVNFKNPIRFAWDSEQIKPVSNKQLSQTARILKKYPNHHITVVGYSDSTGDKAYNKDLSERRAKAVANALIRKGVPEQNVSYKGLGATNFVATNKTAKGRAANRRVELELTAK